MYTTSYHNHTKWSDGAAGVKETIEAAKAAGLAEVGISDHYVLSPNCAQMIWSMKVERLPQYVDEITSYASDSNAPKVRLGIEADFFPQTVNTLGEKLRGLPFDYVIGSVHFVDEFAVDEASKLWDELTPDELNARWKLYWFRVKQLAESGVYDIVGHMDLPKKFGHKPSEDQTAYIDTALDAIAKAGMVIEINTSGYYLPAKEAYPAPNILRAAHERGIPLVINADAHQPCNLARGFEQARKLAKEAGYTQVMRFEKRERTPITLP